MPLILSAGYEVVVRTKLGAKENELPDADINQPLVVDLAEATIIKRVPNYSSVAASEKLFLENAVVSYICYLLCPSMARRVNQEVTTIDVKWKKEKVDWEARAQAFLADVESSLSQITSVTVEGGADGQIFAIARLGGEEG